MFLSIILTIVLIKSLTKVINDAIKNLEQRVFVDALKIEISITKLTKTKLTKQINDKMTRIMYTIKTIVNDFFFNESISKIIDEFLKLLNKKFFFFFEFDYKLIKN